MGFVCVVSGQINLVLYERLGMKRLIIYVQIITIVAASFIVMVQQKILKFDGPVDENLFVSIAIPLALLFMSCAIQVGFTGVVQSAYQDERIFPFSRKATAINLIILVSKTCNIHEMFRRSPCVLKSC